MPKDKIVIRGARQHNLKDIDLELPRDRLIVITGVSGSGKSSLAFDTIYAEGQRRYVESLSAYARQFLGQMDKPDVDHIEGLSPAISIDQRSSSRNPRSTVGTVTEIYDYMRLLYARVGVPHCPRCGRAISRQTIQQIVDAVLSLPEGTRFMILAPLIKDRKGEHRKVFEDIRRAGFVRARVNSEIRDVGEEIVLDRYRMHTIEAVIDRLVARRGEGGLDASRLADSIETALKLGDGVVIVARAEGDGEDLLFSEHLACVHCGISLPQIEPRSFSFNSPHGACPACSGLGVQMVLDPDLIIPARELTLAEWAIQPWSRASTSETYYGQLIRAVAEQYGFSVDVPASELTPGHIQLLLYGSGDEAIRMTYTNHRGRRQTIETTFEGVIPNLQRRHKETTSDYVREEIERYMTARPCAACGGARLRPESLAVTIAGRNIVQVAALPILGTRSFFGTLPEALSERDRTVAHQILKELLARLSFLIDVGLDYLTLDRAAATLSGGEAQRIRLATQIGSQLMGVLYILDEPSIGLHQRDNQRLIDTLKRLRDLGNTVLVVEHDEDTIREADYIVDLGPGAGENGGHVVGVGSLAAIEASPQSLTGQYLRGERHIPLPDVRRNGNHHALLVRGASENNLKGIDVRIPLGKLVCITGVSGSGKSTLMMEIIHKRLAQVLHHAKERPGAHREILGIEHLDKVIDINQSPIGRTPRSNPATYTGLFGPIRELFASVPEARLRGYKPGRFSFNVKGGRCEACQGDGIIKIEMQFLPDVYVPCEVCQGQRYNREALEILYRGKTISEVLNMTVGEAAQFFASIPAIRTRLETLNDVGLGYIRLGQPATTLSGGESQRIKLSRELSRRATGRTLYILDEPTVGLHMADVERLLGVLGRLADGGNTILIIEHNLDVIKTADWVIDLGPEGGDAGGRIVSEGTPEQIAATPGSYTGQYLRRALGPLPGYQLSAVSRQPSGATDE